MEPIVDTANSDANDVEKYEKVTDFLQALNSKIDDIKGCSWDVIADSICYAGHYLPKYNDSKSQIAPIMDKRLVPEVRNAANLLSFAKTLDASIPMPSVKRHDVLFGEAYIEELDEKVSLFALLCSQQNYLVSLAVEFFAEAKVDYEKLRTTVSSKVFGDHTLPALPSDIDTRVLFVPGFDGKPLQVTPVPNKDMMHGALLSYLNKTFPRDNGKRVTISYLPDYIGRNILTKTVSANAQNMVRNMAVIKDGDDGVVISLLASLPEWTRTNVAASLSKLKFPPVADRSVEIDLVDRLEALGERIRTSNDENSAIPSLVLKELNTNSGKMLANIRDAVERTIFERIDALNEHANELHTRGEAAEVVDDALNQILEDCPSVEQELLRLLGYVSEANKLALVREFPQISAEDV